MSGTQYSPTQLGVRPAPVLVQQLLIGAFGWMFAGLLLSAAIAWVVAGSFDLQRTLIPLMLPLIIGQFVLALAIQFAIRRIPATLALGMFFVFAASMGLTLGVIVSAYELPSVASAFFSAAAMFGGASIFGAVTKRELAGLGGYLRMGIIGLIVASVVNLIFPVGPLGWIISIIGVVLFTVLTAYDVQRISRGDFAAHAGSMEKGSVLAATNLYLDFINIFLFLLRLMGGNRN